MVDVGYSEFSFGYAFTENLIRSNARVPIGAPFFPNLREEAIFGFDIMIAYPAQVIFFQFKLPKLLTQNNARELAYPQIALNIPFFRMPIMQSDNHRQHNTLVSLDEIFPGCVYYASPEMSNPYLFNYSYINQIVHVNTALFSPSDIGCIYDSHRHAVVYEKNKTYGFFCSEPMKIKKKTIKNVQDEIKIKFEESLDMKIQDIAEDVLSYLLTLSMLKKNDLEKLEEKITKRLLSYAVPMPFDILQLFTKIILAREIAKACFGLEMLLAQKKPEK